jgi:hypothetical protein
MNTGSCYFTAERFCYHGSVDDRIAISKPGQLNKLVKHLVSYFRAEFIERVVRNCRMIGMAVEADFYDKYKGALFLEKGREKISPFKGPSKPL